MGVISSYGEGVYGIGDGHGGKKSKKHKGHGHYSVTQHIEDHLG